MGVNDAGQTVAEAGEDAVLGALMGVVQPFNAGRGHVGLELGPGNDDAAVLSPSPGSRIVMTTDTMSEGQDFRRTWWSDPVAEAMDVGTKAAAQNLSDINGMGAEPTALLISLTLPGDVSADWAEHFTHGIIRACSQPGAEQCVIAGGDLGSGETIAITITAVGELPAQIPGLTGSPGLRRDGARPGDLLTVAGNLGYAAAGLALLESPDTELDSPDPHHWSSTPTVRRALAAQKRPHPPLVEGRIAVLAGASAGMDISDGLLRDADRLAKASGVRLELDEDALRARAEQLAEAAQGLERDEELALEWVLTGGEDYSLLVTFPPQAELPEGFSRIGTVIASDADQPGVLTPWGMSSPGWDSLKG
ncbi:thiamine-phosphate kinase [Nesterenkonia sp. NBAIMH1]|uniref:thiamine-phosphate kinase n=1 Tax=Nesterenkonia sp. NBAIMH1 TaxID=2600320 RepID=UPI0011B4A517|nr:thiamine-phosphate kinase [Nesterenkonia sp. NBAIMH1]